MAAPKLLTAFVLSLLPTAVAAQQKVSIVRDTWGVPHVFAESDAGAFYGAGYAAAQDRFFQMCWSRLRYQGRTAEFFGPGANNIHVEQDIDARTLGWARQAKSAFHSLQPATQDLLVAYANGVNDYLLTQPALHPLFAQYQVPPTRWTPIDCIGVWFQFGNVYQKQAIDGGEALVRRTVDQMLAAGSTHTQIAAALYGNNMMDDSAAAVFESDVSPLLRQRMATFAQSKGIPADLQAPLGAYQPSFSEAVAVSGSRVVGGGAVLVGMPRIPVTFPNTFAELHMSGATFNVRGAVIPGTPMILSGSSEHCAWSPTALQMDMSDLFKLHTDAQHPDQYRLDGVWKNWTVDLPEVVKVKNGASVSLRYRTTHFGPLVSSLVNLPGEDYALRGVPFDQPGSFEIEAFLGMYRANLTVELFDALEHWRFPSVNLVFGGADGSIGYSVVGAIPVRAAVQFLPGRYALDGDKVANDWQTYVPHALRPWVIDPARGYAYSGNHLPVGSWYPMKALIPGIGDTMRSRALRDVLDSRPTFNEASLRALTRHTEAAHAGDLVEVAIHLQGAQGFNFSANAQNALAVLTPWYANGSRMDDSHYGVAVAQFVKQTLVNNTNSAAMSQVIQTYGGREPGMSLWLRETLRGIGLQPPRLVPPADATLVDEILAGAWTGFVTAPGSPFAGPTGTWLDWYRAQYLSGQIQRWKLVDGPGPLQAGNFAYGPLLTSFLGTLSDRRGGSFDQFVPLNDPDRAQSILALGQSEFDTSPFQLDQVPMWSHGQLKASPMQRASLTSPVNMVTSSIDLLIP